MLPEEEGSLLLGNVSLALVLPYFPLFSFLTPHATWVLQLAHSFIHSVKIGALWQAKPLRALRTCRWKGFSNSEWRCMTSGSS